MVAGIVLFAFAMKETLAHVGDVLDTVPALCLAGGSALYLLAYLAVRWRVAGSARGGRSVAALACALLIPMAMTVPAVGALAALTAVWIALHAYELIWWREVRAETRARNACRPPRLKTPARLARPTERPHRAPTDQGRPGIP
jgi:low temperature requirement protein LtrA